MKKKLMTVLGLMILTLTITGFTNNKAHIVTEQQPSEFRHVQKTNKQEQLNVTDNITLIYSAANGTSDNVIINMSDLKLIDEEFFIRYDALPNSLGIIKVADGIVTFDFGAARAEIGEASSEIVLHDSIKFTVSKGYVEIDETFYIPFLDIMEHWCLFEQLDHNTFNVQAKTELKELMALNNLSADDSNIDNTQDFGFYQGNYERIITINDEETGLDWVLSFQEASTDDKNLIMLMFELSSLGNDHYMRSNAEREEVLRISGGPRSEHLGYIGVKVIIAEDESHGNAAQLDHIFESGNDFYYRMDLKLIKILEKAKQLLMEQGIEYEDKVVMEGFSQTAIVANRFAALWPEYVYAIFAGSPGGGITMVEPLEDGTWMEYPWGIKGYETLMGRQFNVEEYNKIIKYFYIGNIDNQCSYVQIQNDSTFGNQMFSFGAIDSQRIYAQIEYLRKRGYKNFYFKVFENVIHSVPHEYIDYLLAAFREDYEDFDMKAYISSENEIERLIGQIDVKHAFHGSSMIGYDERTYMYNFEVAYDMDLEIILEDKNFKEAVYETIGKSLDEPLLYEDIYRIRILILPDRAINSIEGIKYFNNLLMLELENNNIADFTELSKLKFLIVLRIGYNQAQSDLDELSGLTNLVVLKIPGLNVDNLDFLDNLNRITELDISSNPITDVAVLSKYTNMIDINIDNISTEDRDFMKDYKYFNLSSLADGDVAPLANRDGNVTVGDALVALRFALTLEIPNAEDIVHGDVAPLDAKKKPSPDGVINVGDALVILRKALGIISF